MDTNEAQLGFLLTRQWRDRSGGIELSFWFSTDAGPIRVVIDGSEAVCFIERDATVDLGGTRLSFERRPLDLKTLTDKPVDGLY
ncbi:MAG: DNA polymerase II, partial [Geminicoccaceae bacterium]